MKSELQPSPMTGQHWLVVDDDESVREFIATLLELSSGAPVARFASATEALRFFAAAPRQYPFIITDFDMPGMNGVEFCRQVQALAPGVKVLLVTGQTDFSEAEALRLGFCGLIRKPFPATTFWQALETVAA